jgi:hypothetical protein
MTDKDKKTLRIGAVFVVLYLVCFYGYRGWKRGEAGRNDYHQLVQKAEQLQNDVRAQENKVLLFEKLTNEFKLDPRKISKETLVADASAAIQAAAREGGIVLGPFRETPGRGTARELSTIQVEGMGPVAAAMGLLHKLQTLGFPLIIDSVQFTQPSAGGGGGGPPGMPRGGGPPGALKINLTIILLNYEQFKAEAPNA